MFQSEVVATEHRLKLGKPVSRQSDGTGGQVDRTGVRPIRLAWVESVLVCAGIDPRGIEGDAGSGGELDRVRVLHDHVVGLAVGEAADRGKRRRRCRADRMSSGGAAAWYTMACPVVSPLVRDRDRVVGLVDLRQIDVQNIGDAPCRDVPMDLRQDIGLVGSHA